MSTCANLDLHKQTAKRKHVIRNGLLYWFLNAYLSFLFSKNLWREAFLAIGSTAIQEKDLYQKRMV